jgi:hypothetical protein
MPFLDQAEADALLAMEKQRVSDKAVNFPMPGESLAIPLTSNDGTEHFVLDIQRKGQIKISKITYQNRARKEIILARLDVDGPPHRNPDQTEVPCPHVHLYREGYDDRWAYPLPAEFTDAADLYLTCQQFMTYCNVVVMPHLNPSLI